MYDILEYSTVKNICNLSKSFRDNEEYNEILNSNKWRIYEPLYNQCFDIDNILFLFYPF